MGKNRCSMCGGRLKNGACADCGWRDGIIEPPLAQQPPLPAQTPPKRGRAAIVWSVVSAFLILLPLLFKTMPMQMLTFSVREQQIETAVPDSAYENATRPLAADGVSTELTLEAGNYIVGVDIAEGLYKIEIAGRRAELELDDKANQISLFSSLHEDSGFEPPYLENYRLYEGATLRVHRGAVLCSSENALPDALQTLPPSEDDTAYPVQDGAVAGIDFPEGTYDITVRDGEYGSVRVSYSDRYYDCLGFRGWLGTDEGELQRYRNVEFPKGTLLGIADVEIILEPSARNSLAR